jgi:amylosucrase
MLLYSVIFAFGGIPLIYMGDELAMRNDPGYLSDPALADDNRWMHRPFMDWAAAGRRHDQEAVEGQVFGGMRRLATARKDILALRTGGLSEVLGVDDDAVFAWRRRHPKSGNFIGLANFADTPRTVSTASFGAYGWLETAVSSDGPLEVIEGRAHLGPWGFAWLVER